MGWAERPSPDPGLESVLRMQVKELNESFDTLWHRHADLKRALQRLLTSHDSAHGEPEADDDLVRGLRRVLADHMDRRPVASPHQMRLKHLRWHAEWTASDADTGEDPVAP